MLRRVLLVLVVTGCKQVFGLEDPQLVGQVDSDARSDPDGDSCSSFSTQFNTCWVGPDNPSALVLSSGAYLYNTDTHALRDPSGASVVIDRETVTGPAGEIDVVFASSFMLGTSSTLRVVGSRPFGIAASGAIQIDGLIDLADNGAGARTTAACGTSVGTTGQDDSGGGGGGGGGSFQGRGGAGGTGNADDITPSMGGMAGSMIVPRPFGPIGGCAGGAGGDSTTTGGLGGPGGGAIVIASATSLAVGAAGRINAGGGGGDGGNFKDSGGAGGGSGGFILLESAMVTIAGAVGANGGGGGEGADSAEDGAAGANGAASATPAAGGTGLAQDGAAGAAGSAGTSLLGSAANQQANGGGGGGGGGAGFIAIASANTLVSGTLSPPFVAWP